MPNHPEWPRQPGVDEGCDDRSCATCYLPPSRGERRSYTIIIATERDDVDLAKVATSAADMIAAAIDDSTSDFDVDVIEGTFGDPLSGDNIHGLGHTTEPERVKLRIETVMLTSGHLAEASLAGVEAWAAIAYEPGPHRGIHFLMPFGDSVWAARDYLLSLIDGHAFPYEIENRER